MDTGNISDNFRVTEYQLMTICKTLQGVFVHVVSPVCQYLVCTTYKLKSFSRTSKYVVFSTMYTIVNYMEWNRGIDYGMEWNGYCNGILNEFRVIKPKWFDRGKSWKWAFETNKIFALDQSLPSFQGETNMFSASLSIASFDKKKWAWFITSKEYVVILTPWQYRIGKSVK